MALRASEKYLLFNPGDVVDIQSGVDITLNAPSEGAINALAGKSFGEGWTVTRFVRGNLDNEYFPQCHLRKGDVTATVLARGLTLHPTESPQEDGSVFQEGDVVDVNPAIITGIYAAKFREMGCKDPHTRWTILNCRTGRDNGIPYTEWLAGRGEVQAWIEEKNLVVRHTKPLKVSKEMEFSVGDVVDLKPGYWIEIEGVPRTVQGLTMAGSGWRIVEVKDDRYLVTTDAMTGWVSANAVVARPKPELPFKIGDTVRMRRYPDTVGRVVELPGDDPYWQVYRVRFKVGGVEDTLPYEAHYLELVTESPKPEPLTMHFFVEAISDCRGGAKRVHLESGRASVVFYVDRNDKTIRLDDEYTVTIAKKGC